MSKVTFKFPMGIKAECTITGFKGTIICRHQMINGSVQYGLQPPMRNDEATYIPDAYHLDEAQLKTDDKHKVEEVEFLYETGDKVKNRVNGFTGIITHRIQFQNGCVCYRVEGGFHDGKEVSNKAWQQELELIDHGLNASTEKPIERKRTGGPITRETMIKNSI